MAGLKIFLALTLVVCLGAMPLAAPAAEPSTRTSLEGAWTLESAVQVRPDGSTLPVNFIEGSRISGMLHYGSAGWMSLQITGLPRPAAERPKDLIHYPPEQAVAVLGSYYAYYARYEVDPIAGKVRHHIVQSLRPHEIGLTYERAFSIQGDRLMLEAEITAEGEKRINRLVWQRLR